MEKLIESNTLYINTTRKHLRQLYYLRWIALAGQLIAITLVNFYLRIPLPILPMLCIAGGLCLFNIFVYFRIHSGKHFSEQEIFLHLIMDILAFTGQLYFSGGAYNPFISLFLLQIIIAATILPPIYTWLMVAITLCCYLLVSFFYVEIPHFLHYHLGQFFNLHVHGMFTSFALSAVLIAYFIVKLANHLKERDAMLEQVRDQAKAEEHIIKLGMMAAGAAHELGTPLSTIAVLTRELQREGELYPELISSFNLLESQVNRCKASLSEILSSTHQLRAEEAHIVSLDYYIETIIQRWKQGISNLTVQYNHTSLSSLKVVAERVFEQAVINLLDNAAEAAQTYIDICAEEIENHLKITITDDGTGIPSNHTITPHASTKANGNGLGLFLSHTVVQRLGGSLDITRLTHGSGTCAIITIPLEALCA